MNLDQSEALIRGHPIELVAAVQPSEADLAAASAIKTTVSGLSTRYPQAQWFLPLAIGNHIDHRLVRNAGWNALQHTSASAYAAGATPCISFYEDLPYAAEAEDLRRSLPSSLRELIPDSTLRGCDHFVNDALRWKLELLRVYWSQFTWPRIERLGRYARSLNPQGAVERVWTPEPA